MTAGTNRKNLHELLIDTIPASRRLNAARGGSSGWYLSRVLVILSNLDVGLNPSFTQQRRYSLLIDLPRRPAGKLTHHVSAVWMVTAVPVRLASIAAALPLDDEAMGCESMSRQINARAACRSRKRGRLVGGGLVRNGKAGETLRRPAPRDDLVP